MKKRQFLVTKVKPDVNMKGVEIDGQRMDFSKSGYSFYLSDKAKAHALDQALGSAGTRDVVISEVPVPRDGVHNYTWSIRKPDNLIKDPDDDKYEWVEVKPGVKKLVLKEEKE